MCAQLNYLCVWCPDKGVPLQKLHESYLSFKQSKPHPNTVARSKTKWHVTELRSFRFLLCCKSTRGTTIYLCQQHQFEIHVLKGHKSTVLETHL